jgi:hypothetical protein
MNLTPEQRETVANELKKVGARSTALRRTEREAAHVSDGILHNNSGIQDPKPQREQGRDTQEDRCPPFPASRAASEFSDPGAAAEVGLRRSQG